MVDHAIFQTLSFWMCKRGKPSFTSIRRHGTPPLCDLLYFKINYGNYDWTTWNCCSGQIPAVFFLKWWYRQNRVIFKMATIGSIANLFYYFCYLLLICFREFHEIQFYGNCLWFWNFQNLVCNWIFVSFLPYL